MTREELRDYVEEQRSLNNIPYHVYSELIDGIDTLEQEPICPSHGIDCEDCPAYDPCGDVISRQAGTGMKLSEFEQYAKEHGIVPVSINIYQKMISDSVMLAKRKEVLQEIRQKIDGLRYDHLIGNVSNYAVIDTALEIIDAHIAEEQA